MGPGHTEDRIHLGPLEGDRGAFGVVLVIGRHFSRRFHDRVHHAYAALCESEPIRIRRIDASQPIDAIHAAIWAAVETHIAAHPLAQGPKHV